VKIEKSKFLAIALTLLAAVISLILIWMNTIRNPGSLNWNEWAFYEWLVNYQTGFVRRGLSGEILQRFFYGREVEAINYLAFFLGACYVFFSANQALQIKSSAKDTLLYVFAPMGFFSIAVSNEYFYRKEILFFCAILGVAALFRAWNGGSKRYFAWWIYIVILLSSLVFPLVHEAYVFYCTLFFSLILSRVAAYHAGEVKSKKIVIAYIAFNVLFFLALSVFKGRPSQGMQIWESLSPAAKSFSTSGGISGGISAIGWSTVQGIKLPLTIILSGTGLYYIFPLALVYLIVAFIKSSLDGKRLLEVCSLPIFIGNFLLVFITFAPLFVLGWDWGRWVLGIFVVFSTMVFSGLLVDLNFQSKVNSPLMRFIKRKEALFALLFLISFFTRTPECCIVGSGASLLINKLTVSLVQNFKPAPHKD
jgi:hypothetical protein